MVVVAVVKLPALPFLLVCENIVCGGLVVGVGSGDVAEETAEKCMGDVDVAEVEVDTPEGRSIEPAASLLSREGRGVPAVMIVSTD